MPVNNPNSHLLALEEESIYIIREAYATIRKVALLWSMGKDSTVLLHLIRKAFIGTVPFPVVHIDTGYKFKEIYKFRDRYAKKWKLDMIIAKNTEAQKENISPDKGTLECCTALKTDALKMCIAEYSFKALYLAIRRDEHGIRAKERFFSPRDKDFTWDYMHQPPELWDQYKTKTNTNEHLRVHPLLSWTESDVWEYMKKENIPAISLYFSKNGKRYRSIGCERCCEAVASDADTVDKIITELKESKISERSGRSQDKESAHTMEKLRSLGYM
ncbi:sulfate adenylyltransferase subunit CysD [Spirochaetota bacterium]